MSLRKASLIVLVLSLVGAPLGSAVSGTPSTSKFAARHATASPLKADRFSDQELDQLLGPIALYPDPLLAQVVPASTFVDQVTEAYNLLGGKTDDNLIQQQNWDISVKSVAHYPQVLEMMATQTDWTTTLGQAYVNQSTDVMKSVQRLRAQAKNAGALQTTPQQQVVVEKEVIKILPAQPQVIYVPQYDPQVVYAQPSSGASTGTAIATAAISFGAGMALGAWLNRDCDWNGNSFYYHGWSGGGWVGTNRNYVNANNNYYVNRNWNNVNVNRNINSQNVSNYRADLNNRARTGQQLDINRGNVSRDRATNSVNKATGERVGNRSNQGNNVRDRANTGNAGNDPRNRANSGALGADRANAERDRVNANNRASTANRSADNVKNRAAANGGNTQNLKARANSSNAGGQNRDLKNSSNRADNTTNRAGNTTAPRAAAPRANNAGAGGGPWGMTPGASGGGVRSSNAAAPARQQGGTGGGLKAKSGQGSSQRPASGGGGGGPKARDSAPKGGDGGGGHKRKG
jgi:hypothetical protein